MTPDADDRPARVLLREAHRAARQPGGRTRAAARWSQPAARDGSLVALAARAQRRIAKADIAVVNEGNSRASIDAGPITYAELFERPPTSTRCCAWS